MTDYLRRQPLDFGAPGVSSLFDELSFWSSHFGDLLFRHYDFAPNLTILDLGCGNGFPLFEMAHSLGPSCRIVGLDVWKGALRRAAFKKKLYELDRVALVRGDGARLPFRQASFDRIVSNLGLNNFADPPAVMAECFRILRPGGRLSLTTNARGHMGELYAVYRDVLGELGGPASLEKLQADEHHRASRDEIEGLFERAGFRVLRVVEETFVMRYLDGSALLRHSLTRFGFLDGWRSAARSEAAAGDETATKAEAAAQDDAAARNEAMAGSGADEDRIFSELEKRLNEKAGREGSLRMTVPMLYIEGGK